jgi:hypothetical protein
MFSQVEKGVHCRTETIRTSSTVVYTFSTKLVIYSRAKFLCHWCLRYFIYTSIAYFLDEIKKKMHQTSYFSSFFQMLCHIFAILLHYAFLSNFSWLMNEAFNQYIVITYAAHSHSDQLTDNGSMIRYYILGWRKSHCFIHTFYDSQGILLYGWC